MIANRLRIAIQKKGRLHNESMDLLKQCGLKFRHTANELYCHCENMAVDLLFVRDDDIPTLVTDDVCDVGIVGENVLLEKTNLQALINYKISMPLNYGQCRLSIAVPNDFKFESMQQLAGKRIATSYPNLLKAYLVKQNIDAHILTISGSVEIAPRLQMADAICDLVSTGKTLEDNYLKEVATVFNSQAVLINNENTLDKSKQSILELLKNRMAGVLKAQESKYILFHAPKAALEKIKKLLPGAESPTIMHLENHSDMLAVHAVAKEAEFWNTLEKLKAAGASSILVLPIEKMLL